MKLKPFNAGAVVRLTDHRKDAHFRENHWDLFDDNWQRFWDEYVDRNLYIRNIENLEKDSFDTHIYLEPLPDYVDKDTPFYSHEIEGDVHSLPEELFEI